jgi:elongation factor 1-gamma
MMKTNKTPEYLTKFPLGKIPSFETASGFNVTEAHAIAYFLAESGPKKDQLLGSTAEERALVQQWMSFNSEHLQATIMKLVRPMIGMPYDAKVEEAALIELKRWLEYVEGQIKGRAWLLPASSESTGPSLADLSVGQALKTGFKFYLDAEMRDQWTKDYPGIITWWSRLIAIPEVDETYGAQQLLEKRKELK